MIAICSIKMNCVPFRGWALIPENSRGSGYNISEVTDVYDKYVDNMI